MSNRKSGPKLFRKLSSRFKKRGKDSQLKAIKESAQNPEIDNIVNSNDTLHVKGRVRRNDINDEKLINEMNIEYKNPEFDSVDYVLSNLPNELSMDYLLERSQYYKEHCDAVERTFKKRLLDNSHSFIIGMQQIQDVKLDLHLTNVLCRNARRTLAESDKSLIHKCFAVIDTYQRRKRMVETLKICYEIQKLKDIEQEFHKYLDRNDFISAIDIHQRITHKIFTEFKQILCLELMRKRFRDGTKVVTNKLSKELLTVLYEAPQLNKHKLSVVLCSYHKLSEFHLINALLQDCTIKILVLKCTQIICKHSGQNQAYINRNYGFKKNGKVTMQTYRSLCKKLKPQSFMLCFMDICGRVFDILHLYYKIESQLIKFRAENEIRSDEMNVYRKNIWNETQNLLGHLLELSSFSLKTKIKMEDLLLALHSANIFKVIGQSFSQSESKKLSQSIRSKCVSYLDHFRKTFWESIKTNFDNEMWVVLPIPANFGIHSIKELQRNTQWTIDNTNNDSKEDSHDKIKNKLNDEINIYQKFLSGTNIFDKLSQDKTESDSNKRKKPSNIFDTQSHIKSNINRPSDDGSEPCITSTSLNLCKFLGKCLQIMESLSPVSYDSFIALRDSFKFYLYHVFIWFGVNVHNFFAIHESEFGGALDRMASMDAGSKKETTEERQRRIAKENQRKIMAQAQKLYPVLTQVINEVNESLRTRKLAPELEDLIQKKLQNRTRRPKYLPHFAKCYMEGSEALELYSARTMSGVAARFVATETLPFLVSVIKSQHGRLINILSKDSANKYKYGKEVSSFIAQIENVVFEFKKYMYRNVPTLLVHLGRADNKDSIKSHINNTNWNMRQLKTEPNSYVSGLIEIFTAIENVLSSFPTLPKFIHFKLNKEAIIYVEEQLVEAYSDCKRCTTEGRALMSLDQSVLKKSYPISKYQHSWEYTTNFIQAYYLPQSDLIKWVKTHPCYPLKAHKSFLRIGRAAESLKRNERRKFERDIERVYNEAKLKQAQLIKEQQITQMNKPNLKEINQNLLRETNTVVEEEKTDTNGNYDTNNNSNHISVSHEMQ